MIRQNIVFIENKAGSLQKVTELLKEAGIDIYGFACFDAPEFALFRMVTDKAEEAERVLTENGYIFFSFLNHWRILLRASLDLAICIQSRLGPLADLEV